VQGKGVEEFVQFELEPKILGEAKLGYEEVHSPEMFQPHFGVDESGKGDFFGPLVISGAYVDQGIARKLLDAGVVDSKRISSDARIRALADTIRKSSLSLVETVLIAQGRYRINLRTRAWWSNRCCGTGERSILSSGQKQNQISRWRRHRSSRERHLLIGWSLKGRRSVCGWTGECRRE